MYRYLFKKMLMMIPVLFGITVICFVVIHLAPGKPTDMATQLNVKVSLQARAQLEKLYGLDKPLLIQYKDWLIRFVQLDFGTSFMDGRNVLVKIRERIPVTLLINGAALVLIFLFAIVIGVMAAVYAHTWLDHLITVGVFIGFAIPTFWLALVAMSFFSVHLGLLPLSGLHSIEAEDMSAWGRILDTARHLVLPIGIAVFGGLAGLSRYVRSSMISVLKQDYIRTARAKGLSEMSILLRHALRNALLPVVTLLGLSIPGLIGGSVIFETLFAIPGMGRLFYDAVMSRDYPVIMGILVIGAVLTLIGNLAADLAYAAVDPRIRR